MTPYFPNAGKCECERGYAGDDCSGLIEPLMLNVRLGTPFEADLISLYVITTLTSLTFIYSCYGSYTVMRYYKTSTVFKTANPWPVSVRPSVRPCVRVNVNVNV